MQIACLGACAELCCSLLEFSPHARGTCILKGRKTKDASTIVTCATTCLGYLSMCRRFWSHAKSLALLGGTLGENVAWCSGHGSSAQADGCGLSQAAGPARHVVLCGHRSVFTSGRRIAHFSTNPKKSVFKKPYSSTPVFYQDFVEPYLIVGKVQGYLSFTLGCGGGSINSVQTKQ